MPNVNECNNRLVIPNSETEQNAAANNISKSRRSSIVSIKLLRKKSTKESLMSMPTVSVALTNQSVSSKTEGKNYKIH